MIARERECGVAVIGRVLGWLGRKAVLFALLVAALIAHQLLLPSFQSYGALRDTVTQLDAQARALPVHARDAVAASDARVAAAQRLSVAALDERIAAARSEQARAARGCGGDLAAALKGGAAAVVDNRRACIAAALHAREAGVLAALRDTADARRPGEPVPQAVRRHTDAMRRAAAANKAARTQVATLSASTWSRWTNSTAIEEARKTAESSAADYARAKANAERLVAARRRIAKANDTARDAITRVKEELDALVADKGRQLGGNAVAKARGMAERLDLAGKAVTAAWVLLAIIASPLLIRLLCFFVLAPLAMRRPMIRVRVPGAGGGGGAEIAPAPRSAASATIRLAPGEELLVRQDYLQTTSQAGAKATRWLLDWRHPLTSIATGLTFLTRIRGDGEATTVSATRDPFAEVTVMTLPDGAACVLQPRALAAVAQPVDRPLRVTSHWRLFSLNAWLTLQLRYLVFHGPARLVLKGGRGIRVERAEQGRVFGQDQLVGFSATLSYAVTRTETFWPYFLGRESLLKDRVAGGAGVLVVEEAPLAALRRGGAPRRGIEGLLDAGMKVLGM